MRAVEEVELLLCDPNLHFEHPGRIDTNEFSNKRTKGNLKALGVPSRKPGEATHALSLHQAADGFTERLHFGVGVQFPQLRVWKRGVDKLRVIGFGSRRPLDRLERRPQRARTRRCHRRHTSDAPG